MNKTAQSQKAPRGLSPQQEDLYGPLRHTQADAKNAAMQAQIYAKTLNMMCSFTHYTFLRSPDAKMHTGMNIPKSAHPVFMIVIHMVYVGDQ